MYLLQLSQGQDSINLAVFDSLSQGRAFISQVAGYEKLEEDGFIEEHIDYKQLPDYLELEMNGNLVPISKWMFMTEQKIEIDWIEVANLSILGHGLVDGATRVDAYNIDNADVKAYIQKREASFELAKSFLQDKGFEVCRDFKGSEDGEAILYRKPDGDNWQFLTHLDPYFVENTDTIKLLDLLLDD